MEVPSLVRCASFSINHLRSRTPGREIPCTLHYPHLPRKMTQPKPEKSALSSIRRIIWYAVLVPLIAIYILPLFEPVDERHRALVWRFAEQGKYFNYEGHAIWYMHYIHPTSKDTFLLLHGFPTNSYDYEKILPALRKRGSVLAFDFLGFGLSDKPSRHKYSLMEQTDITLALLTHLNVSRVHVFSHDYGVSVGQELLARHLEQKATPQMSSMTFLNGGLLAGMHRPILMQTLLQNPTIGPTITYAINFFSFRRSFCSVFGPDTQPTDEDLKIIWAFLEKENGHRRAHDLLQYMPERRMHRDRWVGALKNTSVPLKMIIGPADPVSGRHHADAVRELVGEKVHLSYLGDRIGHYPQLEAPDDVLRLYTEFLSTL